MTIITVGTTGYFGTGTGPIFIQQSSCSGSETSLLGCSTPYLPTYTCNHYHDVGVTCEGMLCFQVFHAQVELSKWFICLCVSQ